MILYKSCMYGLYMGPKSIPTAYVSLLNRRDYRGGYDIVYELNRKWVSSLPPSLRRVQVLKIIFQQKNMPLL